MELYLYGSEPPTSLPELILLKPQNDNFSNVNPENGLDGQHLSEYQTQTFLELAGSTHDSDMSKRKRSDIEDKIDAIPDRAVRIKASRLQAKTSHGHKLLKDALNLARGFERQKMGRRQKQSSNEPHNLLRLREEVIVLKELDLAKTANDYLFKQMLRTKRIREAEAFVALFGEHVKIQGPAGTAEANVLGRLFKARPVMEVLPGIIQGIRQVLGLDNEVCSTATLEPSMAVQNHRTGDQPERVQSHVEAVDFTGFSDEPSMAEVGNANSIGSETDENALAIYEHRLAAASDASEDDGSRDSILNDLDPMQVSDTPEGQDHDREASSSDLSEDDDDDNALPHQSSAHNTADVKSSTSFLPSLSMGGYYSGSESSDVEDGPRGPAIPKDRKNRRGQRARQQLAELKYGQNAKHLLKQQKTRQSTDTGWDPKRGAVDRQKYDSRQRRFGKDAFARNQKLTVTGANGEVVVGGGRMAKQRKGEKDKGAKGTHEGPLHPSWEAAKKRKYETGKVVFAGKKVTFD